MNKTLNRSTETKINGLIQIEFVFFSLVLNIPQRASRFDRNINSLFRNTDFNKNAAVNNMQSILN